jgi:hypothetical protein
MQAHPASAPTCPMSARSGSPVIDADDPRGADPSGPHPLVWLHRLLERVLHLERRFEPFFRPVLNRLFRRPAAEAIQFVYNLRRRLKGRDRGLRLAEERIDPREDQWLQTTIESMRDHTARHFPPGRTERCGNTKTHAILKAEFIVAPDLPESMRQGLFAEPRTYPAYVRFSGPGPHVEPDINDVGFGSIGLKVMGVPGEKLWDDEHFTQDMTGVCTPTFVSPNTQENWKLQVWSGRHLPIWYFLNPVDSHVLDFLMQSLWNETMLNPLGTTYYSCVPYLLGEGQAMRYWFRPRTKVPLDIPGVPFRPADNYLHEQVVRTLKDRDCEFDVMIQVQTDPFKTPIEDAGVMWWERNAPSVRAATIRIPMQDAANPRLMDFAHNLSINVWHCLPEHRPLGQLNRARKRMYHELARWRQELNGKPHVEPTGAEVF